MTVLSSLHQFSDWGLLALRLGVGTVFLVHGEPVALDALSARIRAERSWPVHIAAHRETVDLKI